ncbi:A/G-specific adenine glycosylase [Bizionia saleffrena]|uniref:Adenine DNA glycosylase n=1 Tax=Bizionia saleffrena TaxID=291189 RepID=A0A8H2LCI8_9FLAO|nr:A/G-specific adenine glycosylase [Bizionia saleffrena]TYB70711.1 A/G-specific adenine glycosylase [Bizionia saleffrena]
MNIQKTLIDWYIVNKRDLPWRNTTDPYSIWLSEIILQQTQVAQGLPYYTSFVSNYPTIFDLADADESDVLKLWQGLGYYSRARNLHTSAQYIATELNGVFPKTFSEIIKLKGVGDYTASAIASFCYNEKTAVIDGNVYRFLSRFYGIYTPITGGKGFKEFKAIAQNLIETVDPATFNQAIMEFGARQCKPKTPDCTVCPFSSDCVAFQKEEINCLPVKLKALKVKKKFFNYIVILSEDNTTIVEQRQGKGIWQNLYQFPLIETDTAANYETVLKAVKALNYVESETLELSLYNTTDIVHKLSHQHLYTKFWIVTVNGTLPEGVPFNKVPTFPVPILIGNFIENFNF